MSKHITAVFAAALLALAVLSPALRADERDQATQFTFSRPVRVPGRTLPAGTYWFEVLDRSSDLQTLGIYSADRRQLVTVVHAFNAERVAPSAHTIITLAQPARAAAAPAVVRWFYPGETIGHQFVYSGPDDESLASEPQITLELGRNRLISQRAGSHAALGE